MSAVDVPSDYESHASTCLSPSAGTPRTSLTLLGSPAGSPGACSSCSGKPTRFISQELFARPSQTAIVLDWDDTLFPTTYIKKGLDLPIDVLFKSHAHLNVNNFPPRIREALQSCEERATETLRKARELAHVVIITLASRGWVEFACNIFFPSVGSVIKSLGIPIVYAHTDANTPTNLDNFEELPDEEVETHFGIIKGRAIAQALDDFYSQYEGQSWKNILSIGDSKFERYGLLAASSAYMQGRTLESEKPELWHPTQSGCWDDMQNGHHKRLRVKCCKLLADPDVETLTMELDTVSAWLDHMVKLDHGFDADFEDLDDGDFASLIKDKSSTSLRSMLSTVEEVLSATSLLWSSSCFAYFRSVCSSPCARFAPSKDMHSRRSRTYVADSKLA